jgi:hypothetical protein
MVSLSQPSWWRNPELMELVELAEQQLTQPCVLRGDANVCGLATVVVGRSHQLSC